jgi:hypothetical protein
MAPKLPTRKPNIASCIPTRIPFNKLLLILSRVLCISNNTGIILYRLSDLVPETFIGNQGWSLLQNNYVPMMSNMKGLPQNNVTKIAPMTVE